MIEGLKTSLVRIKQENDIYKRFTKQERMNFSSDILQKMIEKSEKEYVDLKAVQLRKVEIEKRMEERKEEVGGFYMEKGDDVRTLRTKFEGPKVEQKLLESSLSKIEEELRQSQLKMQAELDKPDKPVEEQPAEESKQGEEES